MNNISIPNLDLLYQKMVAIDTIKEEYTSIYKIPPFNLSHWDVGSECKNEIAKLINVCNNENFFKYEFSYTLPTSLKIQVAKKIGIHESRHVHITPSGTSANLLALVIAKKQGIKNIIILGPCYFQVPIIAKMLGFNVSIFSTWYPNIGYDFSIMPLLKKTEDALWITNPIYCFGEYYLQKNIDVFLEFLERGITLIADECMSINGKELSRFFSKYKNFIGTYAPHKAACINGVKFGLVIDGELSSSDIDYISDCWIGPLPRSIISDMNHFISDNFDIIYDALENTLYESEFFIKNFLKSYPVDIYDGLGHFRVISVKNVSREYEADTDFYKKVIFKSGATYIPMIFNIPPKNLYLSFRINLLFNKSSIINFLPPLVSSIIDSITK